MSIKLMSAIFETEFHDLEYVKDNETKRAKASTCKLVLLAIADHANDDGEAWPGLRRLGVKTALSRQGLMDTIEALKYHNLLTVDEEPSKLHTNNYTINVSEITAMSSHLTTPCKATLHADVKPLDQNHQLSLKEEEEGKTQKKIDTAKIYKTYENNIGIITQMISDEIGGLIDDYPIDWVTEAIKSAAMNNARKMSYIKGTLRNWKENGYGWKPGQDKKQAASNSYITAEGQKAWLVQ